MDISSTETKQRDLFSRVVPFRYVMQEQQKQFTKLGKLYFLSTEEFLKYLHYLLYFLSLLLNFFLLFSVIFDNEPDQEANANGAKVENITFETLITMLGIIIVVLSFIFSIQWIFFRRRIKAQQKILELKQKKAKVTRHNLLYIYIL